MTSRIMSRRDLIVKGGTMAGIGALAASTGIAGFAGTAKADPASDAVALNLSLANEHKIVAAYQIGTDSGFLKQPALNVALLFQSHHRSHRDALTEAIKKIGGVPVVAESNTEYAKAVNAGTLKNQNDILELALKLEMDTVNAYINTTAALTSPDLTKLCARIVADDSLHWTALASTLAQPLPALALSFGAENTQKP